MAYPQVRRQFIATSVGVLHIALCGDSSTPPVLLLHQSPRSWREFAGVLPLLGQRRLAIAMDTVGFGDSAPPPWTPTIERWAAAAHELLDVLGIGAVDVVGHHTGGVIAVEMAASRPDRVRSLILSSTPWIDEAWRERRQQRPAIDAMHTDPDGGHLQQLWRQRQRFYPAGRPELLQAFVIDALRAHGEPEDGHRVVASYRMEDRIDRVRQPTLVIRATADPFAAPQAAELCGRLSHARLLDIEGAMVPLPDQLPEAFAQAVGDFLAEQDRPA